jgi:hypothetical protein
MKRTFIIYAGTRKFDIVPKELGLEENISLIEFMDWIKPQRWIFIHNNQIAIQVSEISSVWLMDDYITK